MYDLLFIFDCYGVFIVFGDYVCIFGIIFDFEMDEDDFDMFIDMIGLICLVECIDSDGNVWVVVWWNGFEGLLLIIVGLLFGQMEKVVG